MLVLIMHGLNILCFKITAAATLRFQGNNSMSLKYDQSVEHEADDLIFRFRSVEQNGLLMSSRHDRSSDRLEVTLDAGRIKIFIHVSLVDSIFTHSLITMYSWELTVIQFL